MSYVRVIQVTLQLFQVSLRTKPNNRNCSPGACDHILCRVVELNMPEHLVSVQLTGNNRCIVLWSVVTVDPSSSSDDLTQVPEGW